MYDIQQLFTVNQNLHTAVDRPKHFTSLKHEVIITGGPINDPRYCGVGPLFTFEGTDAEFIEHRLVDAHDLPNRARGRQTHYFDGIEFRHAKRMSDGRIYLVISGGLLRRRDAGFMQFMTQTLAEHV